MRKKITVDPVTRIEGHLGITVEVENGKVKAGELPLNYWGNMKTNYEAHNRDYTGVYTGK